MQFHSLGLQEGLPHFLFTEGLISNKLGTTHQNQVSDSIVAHLLPTVSEEELLHSQCQYAFKTDFFLALSSACLWDGEILQ